MPFQKASDAAPATGRLIVGVWGEPKTGKTQFALTFPPPIYFFNLDWGLEHHLSRIGDQEVYIANYINPHPLMTETDAEVLLHQFEMDYAAALAQGKGTIAIDTGTALWNLASKVFLDDIRKKRKTGEVYPFDYGNANTYFQNLINQVKQKTSMNLVLVQRAREKYNSSGQGTGVMEQQGNGATPYLTQVQLKLYMTPEKEHRGLIEKCWQTSLVEGTDLSNPTYDTLSTIIKTMTGAA